MSQQNVTLNIEGMSCTNCASGIEKFLEKEGLKDIHVNFATTEATFTIDPDKKKVENIIKGIDSLGYKAHLHEHGHTHTPGESSAVEKKFYFCLLFTIPLFLHMVLPFGILHHPLFQLVLSIPVILVGVRHFGKSAWSSLKMGIPNMDVLISIGSGAAFIYSLIGTIQYYGTPEVHTYLFYETAATIITLVLLGNVLEHRSVKQTTTAIEELSKIQVTKAKKILTSDAIVEVGFEDIKVGDILLINTGDKVPVDGEIIWGEATVDESMISGESLPVDKTVKDKVIGGTIVVNGSIKMIAQLVGKDTLLSRIIELVKNAQQSKPAIQRIGDKVSAIFVPVVVGIALATFLLSYFVFDISMQASLMHSIAVLVISCPCAMGLATPTAVIVGIGRAAKNGILIKGGKTLEDFASIKNIVFDKTGTLTTGNFKIKNIRYYHETEEYVKGLIYKLESHSTHPIAVSLTDSLKESAAGSSIVFTSVQEEKGLGIKARDEKNTYQIGSFATAKHLTEDDTHTVYLQKNNVLIATLDIEDEIRKNAKETLALLKKQGLNLILLSGDTHKKCKEIALHLGIDTVYSEQLPQDKLEIINRLVAQSPTAMVGDGINDAPSLESATVGISLSNATQVAIQSAQVILLKGDDLSFLTYAYQISKHTLTTIKQNLFWAFFYNVVAIPIAAIGLLNPMVAALAMAFSDVVVVGNSLRLKVKRIL